MMQTPQTEIAPYIRRRGIRPFIAQCTKYTESATERRTYTVSYFFAVSYVAFEHDSNGGGIMVR
jgi:hypothetical protein